MRACERSRASLSYRQFRVAQRGTASVKGVRGSWPSKEDEVPRGNKGG